MPAYAPRPSGQRLSPKALGIVIGLHGAALAALLMAKPGLVLPPKYTGTDIINIPLPPPPPVEALPPQQIPVPAPRSEVTNPPRILPMPPRGPSAPTVEPGPIIPITPLAGTGTTVLPDPVPPLIEIRSTEASLLTPPDRARPPYPESKRRMGDEAVLSLRLTIGADGRVTSVEPVGNADRAFLREAQRHIMNVWRYAPATEGGKKVESVKTVRLRFTLEG